MNRKMLLFIFMIVVVVSSVISIDMVDAKKNKDKNDEIENQLKFLKTQEADRYYGYFKCYNEVQNITMFYDEKVNDNCIEIMKVLK